MKFTQVWADIATENIVLKILLAGLLLATVTISFALTGFALKEPLLIERSCLTEVLSTKSVEHSKIEIQSFIRLALIQRFHEESEVNENYFVAGEIRNKAEEMKVMGEKGVRQTVVFGAIEVKDDFAKVEADRILQVGSVKTILPFPLNVKLASVTRSRFNPFGLKILEVERIEEKERKNGK